MHRWRTQRKTYTAETAYGLLRGKHEDILLHGEHMHCNLDDFEDDLKAGKYEIVVHSHPAEDIPVASPDDRINYCFFCWIRFAKSSIV